MALFYWHLSDQIVAGNHDHKGCDTTVPGTSGGVQTLLTSTTWSWQGHQLCPLWSVTAVNRHHWSAVVRGCCQPPPLVRGGPWLLSTATTGPLWSVTVVTPTQVHCGLWLLTTTMSDPWLLTTTCLIHDCWQPPRLIHDCWQPITQEHGNSPSTLLFRLKIRSYVVRLKNGKSDSGYCVSVLKYRRKEHTHFICTVLLNVICIVSVPDITKIKNVTVVIFSLCGVVIP